MKGRASKPSSATQSGTPFRSSGSKNSAVQTKLQVNKPGDAYEVEADKAADKVVNQSKDVDPIATQPISQTITPLQRKEEEVQKKEEIQKQEDAVQKKEDVQMKSDEAVQQKEDVQKKDDIQQKEDPVQQKEDVQKKSEEAVQQKEDVQKKEEIQQKEDPVQQKDDVQMKSDEAVQQKEDVQKKEDIQQKEDPVQQKEDVQMKSNEAVQQKEDVQKKEGIQQKEDSVQKKDDVQMKSDEAVQKKEAEIAPVGMPSSAGEKDPIRAAIQQKEDDSVQKKEDVQMKDDAVQEKEDVQAKEEVQMMSDVPETADISSQLASSKGGGFAMDEKTLSEMNAAFGADFSNVRIHTGGQSIQMNKALGSHAFTNGNDIYFNSGKYDPNTTEGKRLLAHELTHTLQQGAVDTNVVQKAAAKPAPKPTLKPANPLDISQRFALTKEWAQYLDGLQASGQKKVQIDVKIGERFQGTIEVRKVNNKETGQTAKYELTGSKMNYLNVVGWGFLDPLSQVGIEPILVLNKFGETGATTGFLSVKVAGDALLKSPKQFLKTFNENLEQMKFLGLKPLTTKGEVENKFEAGRLVYNIGSLSTTVDGYIEASGGMGIAGDVFTFNLNAKVSVAGLADGEFNIARGEDGKLNGSGDISADIANVNAVIHVEYEDGAVTIQGTGKINSEKFSGEVTLLVTDEQRSKELMNAALGVEAMETEKDSDEPAVKKTKNNQVLAAWGEVSANITPWLSGTAKIGINNKGNVTIVGEVTVDDEVELMEERGKKIDIFKFELRAGYGIPLLGQVFIFASLGMFVNAGFGPLVLKDVGFTGKYSTDPDVLQDYSITGTLGINAFAVLGLEMEAGVGLTLLGHDLKAGVNLTAAAGLRAYAEATPTLEYKEKQTPGGKEGETRLKGHFEAAAQLFLQLAGALFVEIDSPWWSPVPDGREEYPMGEVQYPIGDTMGIGADMDWLVGSPDIPEVQFSPVEFDPDKFTKDVMADPPPRKLGKADANPDGTWEDGVQPTDQTDKPKLEDGIGLPGNDKKKEDLKKLPDEEKYMRALDELSVMEKAKPKPTFDVVNKKAKAVKKKYGIETIKPEDNEDTAEIYVKHKEQNNDDYIMEIPLMSQAERDKLIHAAENDLMTRSNAAAEPDGTMDKVKAREMLKDWKKNNPVVEEAGLIDGHETWDYYINWGHDTEKRKGLKKKGADLSKVEDDFTTKSGEHHKIYPKKMENGEYEIIIESTPTVFQNFIKRHYKKIQSPSEEIITDYNEAMGLAITVDKELHRIASGSEEATEAKTKHLDDEFKQLGRLTMKLIDASAISEIPKENITFGGTVGSFGSSMSIKYLSSKSTGEKSSNLKFTDNKVLMERKGEGGYKYYMNGHLLNADLHGPDEWQNLTPLSSQANGLHKTRVENNLKAALPKEGKTSNVAFKYSVIANYTRGINKSLISQVENSKNEYVAEHKDLIIAIITAEQFVPVSLIANVMELKNVNGKWVDNPAGDLSKLQNVVIKNEIGSKPEDYIVTKKEKDDKRVKYHETLDPGDYIDVGLGFNIAKAIVDIKQAKINIGSYDSLQQEIIKRVTGSSKNIGIKTLESKIRLS